MGNLRSLGAREGPQTIITRTRNGYIFEKEQKSILLSTYEAKYVTMTPAIHEGQFLILLLNGRSIDKSIKSNLYPEFNMHNKGSYQKSNDETCYHSIRTKIPDSTINLNYTYLQNLQYSYN